MAVADGDPITPFERSRKIVKHDQSVLEVFNYFNGIQDLPVYCTFQFSDLKKLKLVYGSLKEFSIAQCDLILNVLLKNHWTIEHAPAPNYEGFTMQYVSYAKSFKYFVTSYKALAKLSHPPQTIPFEFLAKTDAVALKEIFDVEIPQETDLSEFNKQLNIEGSGITQYLLNVPTAFEFYFRSYGIIKNPEKFSPVQLKQ